jgi:hypothetical protein
MPALYRESEPSSSHPDTTFELVILTDGKDLLFARAGDIANRGKQQALRCAQG